jgi:hypothetical protein
MNTRIYFEISLSGLAVSHHTDSISALPPIFFNMLKFPRACSRFRSAPQVGRRTSDNPIV